MHTPSTHHRPYQKLVVWREAHSLCLYIYKRTARFPSYEKSALVNQMRTAAYSVPTNLAEGTGKKSPKERNRFFEYASCSLEELHYQCFLSRDLGYIAADEFTKVELHIGRVGYLLMRLRSTLN